jgi:hypothetical protein
MDVSDSFYLVPSLIPVANSSDMKISIETMQRWTSRSTCTFAFSTTNTKSAISMSKKQAISAKDLETLCFLPSGLFERLMGKLVYWSQQTSGTGSGIIIHYIRIHKDMAFFQYGYQYFRIQKISKYNCLRLDVEGVSSSAVHERLVNLIGDTINECMKCLFLFTAVSFPFGDILSWENSALQFVPLELVKSAILANTNLLGSNGEKLLSFAETKKTYESWLDESLLERDMHDLFLSYPWNDDDKE